jgi:hypothetical protein
MRALAFVFILLGCSHRSSEPTPDAPPGSVEITCESHGTTFPLLVKSCAAATDCFVANHMVDCCGTFTAIGLNVASQAAFTTAETACANAYPGCGCAARPTMAEDGRTEDMGPISVRCDNNLCRTFVP